MRHFLALALLSGRMRKPTVAAGLIIPTGLPQRLAPRFLAAVVRAVAIPAITVGAKKERLPAFRPIADDQAE
jgi:hypothetical protein